MITTAVLTKKVFTWVVENWVLVLVVGVLGYGHFRIENLKSDLATANQQVKQVSAQLNAASETLKDLKARSDAMQEQVKKAEQVGAQVRARATQKADAVASKPSFTAADKTQAINELVSEWEN